MHKYTDQFSACVFSHFPIELGTVLNQIDQAEGVKEPLLGVLLKAPRLFEAEKFKCDCKEMEIADTLLTRAMTAF